MHFLNDLEVAVGFTSTMMTQIYSGTTTIVPHVCLKDFGIVSVSIDHVFSDSCLILP